MNTYDITSSLYDITPRYDLHTHCIHLITPRIPVTASTAAELLLTVYWVYFAVLYGISLLVPFCFNLNWVKHLFTSINLCVLVTLPVIQDLAVLYFFFITSLCKDLLLSHLWLRLCVVKIRDICSSHGMFVQVASPSRCLFYWGRGPTLNPVPGNRSSGSCKLKNKLKVFDLNNQLC